MAVDREVDAIDRRHVLTPDAIAAPQHGALLFLVAFWFETSLFLARMKTAGFWNEAQDKPDFRALYRAFVQTNGWENERTVRTLTNWATGHSEPGASDLGFLANALKCRPEDLLEELK